MYHVFIAFVPFLQDEYSPPVALTSGCEILVGIENWEQSFATFCGPYIRYLMYVIKLLLFRALINTCRLEAMLCYAIENNLVTKRTPAKYLKES